LKTLTFLYIIKEGNFMKKKAISLLLSAAMVGVLAGCAGTETGTGTESANGGSSQAEQTEGGSDYQLTQINLVFDGTLTATVDAGQAEFVDQWEKAIEEKFGYHVDLNITQLDHSDYSGTVSRLLTTGEPGDGEYPDALIMSATMLRQYQTTGLLWDMANAYDNAEFQSRLTLDKINENLKTSSGALYGFAPTYGNGCVTYVKKAWLDAVGIDAASVTDFDSYYKMLQAFTNDDPDGNGSAGTYGVIAAGYGKLDEAPYINYMPEFWQDAYPSFYQNADGVWVDGFTEQATIDALARLNKGYTDGVIDPDTEEAGTKQAREKWFSNDQSTSSGVFTYWAGTWYQTLTDKLIGNEVDSELVELAPIKEIKDSWGGYLNREAPVLTITDDGDGDSAREQAIFDILFDTMLDGDTVQTLWTYGAEGVHWSTEAETFTTNAGTDDAKEYSYEDGQFHLKQSPNDENTVWKKNFLDANLVIAPLTNGYADNTDLVVEGNQFFTENCVDAPAAASSETLTNYEADMVTDKTTWMNQAVVGDITPEQAVQNYIDKYGDASAAILEELNAQ
jgi:multiple sugar transport system substrate-binding protein/putative aldouronate transport system substrate-binding protein